MLKVGWQMPGKRCIGRKISGKVHMRTRNRVDSVVKRFLDEKLDLINKRYSPTHLIVFGSRAKGTARAGSDIDLIIVSDRFVDTTFPNRMGDFLNTIWPDIAVDAICYTPEEFDDLVQRQWPFVKDALASGIEIE